MLPLAPWASFSFLCVFTRPLCYSCKHTFVLLTFSSVQRRAGATLPFFKDDGSPNLAPHPRNTRLQVAAIKKFKAGIKKRGCCAGVRGTPWVQRPKDESQPYLLITNKHTTLATYEAHEEDPNNEYVKATIEAGLQNCEVWDELMPDDATDWLCRHHNLFNRGGVGVTFVEKLTDAIDIENGFKVYRDRSGVTSVGQNAKVYQQTYWAYIQKNFKGKMASFNQFDNCKSTIHTLTSFDVWEALPASHYPSLVPFCSCQVNRIGVDGLVGPVPCSHTANRY